MNIPSPSASADRTLPAVTVIGDINIDMVMGPLAQWPAVGTEAILPRSEMRPGGSAGNVALALKALGARVDLFTSVGNDSMGLWLREQFDDCTATIDLCEAATSITVAVLDPSSERTFLTTVGHLDQQEWAPLARAIAPSARPGAIALLTGVFLLPRLRRRYMEILHSLRGLGYVIALDTGWPPEGWTPSVVAEVQSWLGLVDHLLLNEVEVTSLAGTNNLDDAMRLLAQRLPPSATLVTKLGPRGAAGMGPEGSGHYVPAARSDIFDTVGAGDAFNAGYLSARNGGLGLMDALKAGCETATEIIARFPRNLASASLKQGVSIGETAWPTGV
ncbi:carbohydrate kinase family protein [Asticcacaulis sp. 201]|uniref:carbohydrate kinase family protein n=1 Tax=Asticcacaulis sp. 201 TaxID=3028787 RepID=UPI002916EEF5|nr:carbohydrate kinase family protein [Asticcacaulis sp. 201]MDV6330704.1 carbohydrate kinase family protein [Asticcacaulis sp. 201]